MRVAIGKERPHEAFSFAADYHRVVVDVRSIQSFVLRHRFANFFISEPSLGTVHEVITKAKPLLSVDSPRVERVYVPLHDREQTMAGLVGAFINSSHADCRYC